VIRLTSIRNENNRSAHAWRSQRVPSLTFSDVGGGLVCRGQSLEGFAICGPDRKFVYADARIVGDQVEVYSPKVPQPVDVRFGWADFPVVNLWNKDGLPASPFRTDEPQ
jgi:sialate O-acetylesterase